MSMREHPNSGYVVPVDQIIPLLNEHQQEQAKKLLEECDFEEINDFFGENVPPGFPMFETVYCPTIEDTVDGDTMKHGEWYIVFAEEDLYMKTPREGLNFLAWHGIKPVFSNWSVWG